MASFQYRLAPVLRFRERVKEEKVLELRALNLEKGRLEEQLHTLESELERLDGNLVERQIFSAVELKLQDDYAQHLDNWIARERAALVVFCEKVERKRQELAEAARAVKSLDLLRRRLEEKFRQQRNLEDQKFIDEIGQWKFARRAGRQ